MIKLVIFDIDGTIANTDQMLIETYKTMYGMYRKDLKKIDIERIKTFSGPPLNETLANEFPNEDQKFMYDEYKRLSRPNYIKYATLFPNVKETLLALKKDGYILSIATSKMRSATKFTLNLLNIENIFDFMVCADDISNPKPHPQSINIILDKFKVNKDETIFIGDSKYDSECAKNAGVKCVLMNFVKRDIPDCLKPDYTLDNYEKLFPLIKEL